MRLDLYNNVNTKQILKAIGIKEDDIPRLRGVGIDDGKILIHTRTGGGNRECYEEENDNLTKNEFYLYDEDEEFDCTYANFWYRIPEKLTEKLLKLEDKKSKAVLGDSKVAIGLMFGDKEAIKTAESRLKSVEDNDDTSLTEGNKI